MKLKRFIQQKQIQWILFLVILGGGGAGVLGAAPVQKHMSSASSNNGKHSIFLTPNQQQFIDMRFGRVQFRIINRRIETMGQIVLRHNFTESIAASLNHRSYDSSRSFPEVIADVYALDIPLIRKGERAWIWNLSGASQKIAGRVIQIYPYNGTETRMVRVLIKLNHVLKYQIFCNVEIEAQTRHTYLSVPSNAVMGTGRDQYVFIQQAHGELKPIQVTIGRQGDHYWQVIGKVKAGERVVDDADFLVDADANLNALMKDMQSMPGMSASMKQSPVHHQKDTASHSAMPNMPGMKM